MTLNLCYPGKHVEETICWITLQETVWALSNLRSPFYQVSIIWEVTIISKLVYHLKVSIKVSIKKISIIKS